MAQAYLNQRKLDAEAKQLQANITQFSKQATQWLTLMENMNRAVNVSLVLLLTGSSCPLFLLLSLLSRSWGT